MVFIKVSAVLLLAGCGYRDWRESDCYDGCSGTDQEEQTVTIISGGQPGEAGTNGRDGAVGPTGPSGADGSPGSSGSNGTNGSNGVTGPSGVDGFSIVMTSTDAINCEGSIILWAQDINRNGLLEPGVDTNLSTIEVCDGEDTISTSYEVTEIIDPCGDDPIALDEVLMRMTGGILLGSVSDHKNGNNTRLAVIEPGGYVTTDGTNCPFVVESDGEVVW